MTAVLRKTALTVFMMMRRADGPKGQLNALAAHMLRTIR